MDLDEGLLHQLRQRLEAEGLQAAVERGDLVEYVRRAAHARFDLLLCLGDTLCHLPGVPAVRELLIGAARALAPGGLLALSYRDTTRLADEGTARFREVARDGRRVLHCLLEPVDTEHLRVTDILTEAGPDGLTTRIGDYLKLRLAPARVAALATEAGLTLRREATDGGMVVQVFGR